MKLNNELNNMSWRVRPEEILLEVGRMFGSKIGLQQLNVEVVPSFRRHALDSAHYNSMLTITHSTIDRQSFSLQQLGVGSGRASIGSCSSLTTTQLFTTIGIYKGERVAIKKICKKKVMQTLFSIVFRIKILMLCTPSRPLQVDITSTLLWEIKQARDVSHENTVRFVGACIDLPRPKLLILTEYCPKGEFVLS